MCKAILLCDAILIEPFTHKGAIVGIFENFVVPEFPGFTTQFFAFVQLTNGIGRYTITIEIRDTALDMPIAQGQLSEVEFTDRAVKINLTIPVPPLPLPRAGVYDFIVLADGQEIDRQQFTAITRPEPPNVADNREPNEEPE